MSAVQLRNWCGVLEISPDDPRLLAIHARIIHHREDPQTATDVFK